MSFKRFLSYCGILTLLSPAFTYGQGIVKTEGILSVDRVHPGSRFQVALIVEIFHGWHINAHVPSLDYLIPTELTFEDELGLILGEVIYPPGVEKVFGFSEEKLAVYDGEVILGLWAEAPRDIPIGRRVIRGELSYQACDEQRCFPPAEVDVDIPIEVVGLDQLITRINSQVLSQVDFGEEDGDEVGRLIGEKGYFLAFVFIFLGGLALNLTPCVYPIIPITIGYFGSQSEGRPRKTFLLSLVYVLGLAVTYSALGLLAALSGSILGASLQNPWVLIFIATVLLLLALSSFGLYEVRLPGFLSRAAGVSKRGFMGTLFMGLTVGVVAVPCVGPFVIGLLTYVGGKANPLLGFWMFFALAMGLGLPYLFLGMFSGALKSLPRSGEWMVWVRKIFGLVLMGMALYYIKPLIPLNVFWIVLPLFVICGGVYLGWFERSGSALRGFGWARRAIGISVVAAGVWLMLSSEAEEGVRWIGYDEEILAGARREGRPVIIDFYADWCLPCQELDSKTFADPRVVAEAERFTTLKADLTSYSSQPVEKLKRRYSVLGVPTVVFIDPRGQEREDLRVVGFLGPDQFLERMKEVF